MALGSEFSQNDVQFISIKTAKFRYLGHLLYKTIKPGSCFHNSHAEGFRTARHFPRRAQLRAQTMENENENTFDCKPDLVGRPESSSSNFGSENRD